MSKLKKDLRLFDLILIAVGSTIGSGIFMTPSDIAGELPSGMWIMIVWGIGGVVALTGALTFAELGQMYPKAGGVYVYLKEAFGPMAGFLYGWGCLLVVNTGAIAALSIGFAGYLNFILNHIDPTLAVGLRAEQMIAIGGILLVGSINLLGAKSGGFVSTLFTVLKLLGIGAVVIIGLLIAGPEAGEPVISKGIAPKEGFSMSTAIGAALIGVLWSFGGWHHATYVAAEAKKPSRNIPLAMIIGTVIITSAYLLTNWAYLEMLTVDQIAADREVAANAVQGILGPKAAIPVALLIFISTFGTVGIYTLTSPRVYYAMANDGIFFKGIAKVSEGAKVPVNAIMMQSVWAIILVVAWKTFSNVITYVLFTDWVFMTLAAIGIFIFRYRKVPNQGYKVPLYPVIPLIFIIISLWFILNTLIHEPVQAWAGLGLLGVGSIVFWLKFRKGKPENPS